jgi:hypothetical protein
MAVFSYETYLIVNAAQRLMRLTQKEERIYKTEAYRRCGQGLTAAQFDGVVQALVNEGWCTCDEGVRGAPVLTYIH